MSALPVTGLDEPGASRARYSIRMAARLSGISAHTLRAWERRYGFPAPARTAGGARRYTDDDIKRLELIARTLEAGFRAGDVVAASQASLKALLADGPAQPPVATESSALIAQTLDLVERDNAVAVQRELRRAATLLGPKRFVTDFAHPLAVELGLRWQDGTLSIQQEHLTSDSLRTQLRVLIAGYEVPAGRPRVLLAVLPGEKHTLAIDMVTLYINLAGGLALSLGAAAPVQEIATAADRLCVDAVGISLSGSYPGDLAETRLTALRARLTSSIALWLGGAGAQMLGAGRISAERAANFRDLDALLRQYQGASDGYR